MKVERERNRREGGGGESREGGTEGGERERVRMHVNDKER
jgi:hypothetical protein